MKEVTGLSGDLLFFRSVSTYVVDKRADKASGLKVSYYNLE